VFQADGQFDFHIGAVKADMVVMGAYQYMAQDGQGLPPFNDADDPLERG
jgi:hypothetical protein